MWAPSPQRRDGSEMRRSYPAAVPRVNGPRTWLDVRVAAEREDDPSGYRRLTEAEAEAYHDELYEIDQRRDDL